jgi:hypothetical protein
MAAKRSAVANATESVANETPAIENKQQLQKTTTRELLGQSDQNDWRTPRKFLDAAREVMGAIDLDPATSIEANPTMSQDQSPEPHHSADLPRNRRFLPHDLFGASFRGRGLARCQRAGSQMGRMPCR